MKLDNVLLDSKGNVKLTDYGLAKDGLSIKNGFAETFCGTPECIAPEIFKGRPYSRAVDWWSFGVVLYQLLVKKVRNSITPIRVDSVHG